jgi:hypothetical protein
MPSYHKYKGNIKSGDLLVWSTRKWKGLSSIFPFLVRFFTMSDYNHMGIALVLNSDLIFIIEADVPHVMVTPLKNEIPFYHIPMGIEWEQRYTEFLLSKVGEKYSVWQAIISYFTIPKRDDKWICTELVLDFYEYVKGEKISEKYTPSVVVKDILENFNTKMLHVSE